MDYEEYLASIGAAQNRPVTDEEMFAYVKERLKLDLSSKVGAFALYVDYSEWSFRRHVRPVPVTTFGRWMGEHLRRLQTSRGRLYVDIALLPLPPS